MTILYLGRDDTDRTVTLAVNGTRYEYHLGTQPAQDAVAYMAQRWPGKALAKAKRNAVKVTKG